MPDRPDRLAPPSPSEAARPGRPGDAVFEDVHLPGDGAVGAAPAWVSLERTPRPRPLGLPADPPPAAPGPSDEPDAAPDTAEPYQAPREVGYDEESGFRIDFDEPATSTALAPVRPPSKAPSPRASAGMSVPPPPRPPAAPRAEARRSAIDKARMVRRYRWLIVALTLVGGALGWLYTVLTPPTYSAHSVVLINPKAQEGIGGQAAAPGTEQTSVLNQALILQQAPEIALETAAGVLARPGSSAFTTVRDAAGRYGEPVTPGSYADHLQEEVVTVEPAADQANALRVQAEAGSPQEAALIASLYTDEYTDLTQTALRDRSSRTRQALDQEVARAEGELDELERQLERYLTSRNAAGLDEQTRVTVGQIGQLESQLDAARVEAQTHRARLGQLRADLATVPERLERSADVPSVVETTDLDTQIAADERLLDQIYRQNPGLRSDPAGHPDVAEIDRRLRDLRADRRRRVAAQTDAAVGAGGLSLGSDGANGQAYLAQVRREASAVAADLAGAEARAGLLSSRLAEARGQLRAVPEQRVEIDRLERQRDATAARLRQLQTEADGVALTETTEVGFAQVIRDVQLPLEEAGPGLPVNVGVGSLLGFLLGLGVAFVRHRTDSRVRTPDDLRDSGFAVIGTVPDLSRSLRGERQEVEGASVHPGLVAVIDPFGTEAEAFRHVHAGLYSGTPTPQVVLVGAPEASAGKSLVAANVAIVAAQAGRRTLLIDADLRRPVVGELFGLGEHPLGEGPEGSNFVYWSTAAPGLFAMTPLEAAVRPDQMWAPDQIGDLLDNLRDAFDLVVLDTPAALASATAALLAPHVDAAVLVAEADRTDLEAMTQVATELAGVGLRRVGAVLNKFDARGAVGFGATAAVRHSPRVRA